MTAVKFQTKDGPLSLTLMSAQILMYFFTCVMHVT